MTTVMDRTGLLDGKDNISEFLGGCGEKKLLKYIAAGMPVLIEDGRWLAHKENIEEFFKHYTRKKVSKIPE